MDVLIYLTTDLLTTSIIAGMFGLVVGSFLNVVIYRLPLMMERQARAECAEWLGQLPPDHDQSSPFDLVHPRSHCPQCKHQLTVLENIPLLSYLWQRGRCTACHQPISIRYPLTEVLSAIFAILTAWHFGFGWPLLGALLLTWALLAASIIDIDHQLLPDSITLQFLWVGIFCNLFHFYTDLPSSVIGAIAGYLSLWTIYWLFKLLTGKEGMGYGDFKLLALLGAWMGWQYLLTTVLLSSLVGAVVGIGLILVHGYDKNHPLPFGPYLAAAGWLNFLWGPSITQTLTTWNIYLLH